MTFTALTSAAVAEFAARPFVRVALANPKKPESVLSFFLGLDVSAPEAPEQLRQGHFLQDMTKFWFGGGPEYDQLCQPFAPLVREAGTRKLSDQEEGKDWKSTVNGQIAQLILCDQLSRNCFRGQDEAFQYDTVATDIARGLSEAYCKADCQPDLVPYKGEFYPPLATFVITALMHSESLHDHELSIRTIQWAKEASSDHLAGWWDNQYKYEVEHKQVIDLFGRYPHRNCKLGRKSTQEELEWLADEDKLPAWAKSQR